MKSKFLLTFSFVLTLACYNTWAQTATKKSAVLLDADSETFDRITAARLYPMPATDAITLDADSETFSRLAIFSMQGTLVRTVNLHNQEGKRTTINLQDIPAGIYLMKIVINEKVVTRQFIKQ